jgi:hypothetical protein
MVSITTWTRLEPRARGEDLTPSLEARVHDPAWLLARQYQLAEFVGENAASMVDVAITVRSAPIVAYRAGTAGPVAVEPGVPLDALAGAEPRTALAPGAAAEAGAELLDLLVEEGCSAAGLRDLTTTHPMPAPTAAATLDAIGAEYLRLLADRLPDAVDLEPLLRAVDSRGTVPAEIGTPTADAPAVVRAARRWVRWLDTVVSTAAPDGDAWQDDHLEHAFTLAVAPVDDPASAPYALSTRAWSGTPLDWYDLDVDPAAAPPARPDQAPPIQLPGVDPTGVTVLHCLPTPLRYPGMPSDRTWQFEDAAVAFPQITADRTDLAKMLVIEFASVFSNDWYLWPLPLPVGAMHTVTELTITNTFGEVDPPVGQVVSASADWQLFRPSQRRPDGASTPFDGLLLLPTLAAPALGPPTEEVVLLRDEVANLGWAVETTVEGADGRPVDRSPVAARAKPAPATAVTANDTSGLHYELASDVPDNWYPLVPDASGMPMFDRLILTRTTQDGHVEAQPPLGRLLAPEPLRIWQEELPREGALIRRRWVAARSADGRLHTWSTRQKKTGRGEGSSGLQFDEALTDEHI